MRLSMNVSEKRTAASTILVAGAEGQLGSAAVAYFSRKGWAVVASCRTQADRERVAADAAAAGLDRVTCLTCNLSDEAQVERLARSAEERAGPLAALLNTAGGF